MARGEGSFGRKNAKGRTPIALSPFVQNEFSFHINNEGIHFGDAPADGQDYVRNNNAWVVDSNSSAPIDADLLPDTDCAYDIGSPTFRFKDAYFCGDVNLADTSLIFETGRFSVKDSIDRPGERGVFFKDTLGSDEVELTIKTESVYRNSDTLTFIGGGIYETSEDFEEETLIVYRNGQVIDTFGINRIDITADNRFKFNLASTIVSTTIVSCSYRIKI